MNAAVIERCATPPRFLPRPDPVRADGQALVRMTAAPITPLDLLCASGTSYWGEPAFPYVPGVQGVGTVIDGNARSQGNVVWFPKSAGMTPGDGSMSELVAVEETTTVALPVGLSPVAAAALGLSAAAAYSALVPVGGLSSGECVVVLGAGGAVGQSAVQLARLYGAGRVVGVVHRPASAERAAAKGADAVVDTSQVEPSRLAEVLREACDGGSDLVVDPVFGPTATAALSTMRPHGRFVHLGSAGAPTAEFDSATIRSRTLSILGYTNATRTHEQLATALDAVFDLGARGGLAVDHETRALSDVEASWARNLSGEAAVRTVLSTTVT